MNKKPKPGSEIDRLREANARAKSKVDMREKFEGPFRRREEKVCGECMSKVHPDARRCRHCGVIFATPADSLESCGMWVLWGIGIIGIIAYLINLSKSI